MCKPLKKGQKSWNSGLVVGPKAAFTLREIYQIEAHLQSRQKRHDQHQQPNQSDHCEQPGER
jgi:hypothetical protein